MSELNLHCQRFGEGKSTLVLVHGWGANSGVWQLLLPQLVPDFTVIVFDLPGHGKSAPLDDYQLASVANSIQQQLPPTCHLLGWSLGGLIAQYLVLHWPQQFSSLTLVASSPCFIKKPDWPFAMEQQTLQDFAAILQQDPAQTLQRFLALQVMGSEDRANTLRQLKSSIDAAGYADQRSLAQALRILIDTDLRPQLAQIQMPVLLQYGRCDMIVPVGLVEILQQQLPQAQSRVYTHAGHAPFISDAHAFAQDLSEFIQAHE